MNTLQNIKKDISETYSWDYYEAISAKIMALLEENFNKRKITSPGDGHYKRMHEIYLPDYDYHCANFSKMIKLLKDNGYTVTDDDSWLTIDKGEFWQEPTLDEIRDEIEKRIERSKSDLEKMVVFHNQLQNNLIEIFNSLNETA